MCDEHGNSLDLGAKELRDIKSRNNPPEGTEGPVPRVHTGEGLWMSLLQGMCPAPRDSW